MADVTARHTMIVLGVHGAVALAIIISATVLGVQGTLDASALTALYAGLLGFVASAASSIGSLGAAVNGKTVLSQGDMAAREATLRTAIDGAIASTPPAKENG